MSDISDGAFLREELSAERCELFSERKLQH